MSNDKTFVATQEVLDLVEELRRVRAYREEVKKQEEYITQRLYNIVNEHEELITVDEHGIKKTVATWKYSKDSERFDSKMFRDANPSVYGLYVKITPGSRTLRIVK